MNLLKRNALTRSYIMKVLIFSKPTEFDTINLSGGGQYTSDNSKHVCSYSTSQSDIDVIAYAKAECEKNGLELGSVQEVSLNGNGFYASANRHERELYNYKNIL